MKDGNKNEKQGYEFDHVLGNRKPLSRLARWKSVMDVDVDVDTDVEDKDGIEDGITTSCGR